MTLPRATSDRCTKMSCSSVTCHNVSNKASAERGRGQCLFLPLLLVAAGGGNFLAAAEAAAIKGAHFVLLRAALVALRHNNAEDGVRARGAGGICLAHEALQQMDAVVGRLDVLLRNVFHHSAPVGALHQVQFTCTAKITTSVTTTSVTTTSVTTTSATRRVGAQHVRLTVISLLALSTLR